MEKAQERQFLHNMYFYNRMFNFEVYTLLQAMVNCGVNILVHGRKGAGGDELLNTLFDSKTTTEDITMYLGPVSIKDLYPRRKIYDIGVEQPDGETFLQSNVAVINGLTRENIQFFLEMCKRGQGLASLESNTLNFALEEADELLRDSTISEENLNAIDFVLTVEAHKLVSISEVVVNQLGKCELQPISQYVGGNEYSFNSFMSEDKLIKMRNNNYEEAERFLLSIRTYEPSEE
ncbi:hypothetical protein ABER99_20400 [Paenibacillus glucanolyticus]|uniref:Uncharacterized protein n=1 Tax=Paenibacillus glucanolyticus TaxID=59843 RepID=A0A163GI86_9BACL|nr:hypothetical protein [Paenibacillus glucanolyticus]KZS44986.1 hypothetical protein AWU65_03120 [Paenibacillus glucanolyticus]OMF64801.1 hypothetical protein BK142_31390 [Paenibacillus glucanolyticus]